MLVSIPPMGGEFTLLETGTMQQSQSNIIFLDVDTTDDDANLDACTDEPNDCSLRGAVTLATFSEAHHVIQLTHSSYGLTTTLIIKGHVTLIGLEPYTTITTNSTQDFTLVDAKNANLTFYNLHIYGGRAQGPSGLVIHRSYVNIYNSRFQNNYSSGYSGAIGIVDEGVGIPSHVYIANTVFMDNRAFMGGAILGYNGNGQATIKCSTFENNHAHQGGAIATLHIGTTRFTGQITINRSNMIYNTTAQYGGAAYRNIGNTSEWIEFDSNYWSPQPSNPLLPNPNTLYIVSVDGKPQNNPLPLNCDVPPPPSQAFVCVVATTDNDNDGQGGTYTYARMRSGPGTSYNQINITFNYSKTPNFAIRGVHINDLYEVWYFGDYTGNYLNGTNLVFGTVQGWLRQDFLYTFSDCYYAQYVNAEGESSELPDASYDYDLLIAPPDSWLDTDCKPYITEDEFPNETEREIEENKNRQNCSKIVFYVYYKVFEKVYGRVPKISDVLATSYQNELRTIVDSGLTGVNSRLGDVGFEIARDALAGHYWSVVDEYCDETDICENKISDIEHLVTSYPQNFNGGYLWTLQAWYGKALRMRREFEELRYLEKIIPSDLDETAIKDYIPTQFSQLVGRRALSDEGKSAPTLQWANYGYLTDEYTSLRQSRPSHVVFCMFNLYLGGFYPNGAEDIFIVTTERSYGQSSTFNPANGYPEWSVSDVYSAYRTRNFTNATLLQCSCNNRLCERSN
jgi:hypothetical protein